MPCCCSHTERPILPLRSEIRTSACCMRKLTRLVLTLTKKTRKEGVWGRALCCWPCSCWRRSRPLCPPTRHPLPSPYPPGLSSSLASDQDPSHTLSSLSSAPVSAMAKPSPSSSAPKADDSSRADVELLSLEEGRGGSSASDLIQTSALRGTAPDSTSQQSGTSARLSFCSRSEREEGDGEL